MRIMPIFRGDDRDIFKTADFYSDNYVQSNNKIDEWKIFCQPLLQDTFEKVNTSKKGEEKDD